MEETFRFHPRFVPEFPAHLQLHGEVCQLTEDGEHYYNIALDYDFPTLFEGGRTAEFLALECSVCEAILMEVSQND